MVFFLWCRNSIILIITDYNLLLLSNVLYNELATRIKLICFNFLSFSSIDSYLVLLENL